MSTVLSAKRDGGIQYTKRALGNNTTNWSYTIQIPSIYPPVVDQYGKQRWNDNRQANLGQLLSDDAITPILQLLRRSHAALFDPSPLLLQLPVNWPPIEFDDQLLVECAAFDPLPLSNQNTIVSIYHREAHWYMLVHFVSIYSIVIFNSSGSSNNITLSDDQDEVTYQQNWDKFSPSDRAALQRYQRFTHGSRAAPSSTARNGLWSSVSVAGGTLQVDSWSCGFWCLGFSGLLYSKVSDHHAVYGMDIKYSIIRDEMVASCSDRELERMSITTAEEFLKNEWNNQWDDI